LTARHCSERPHGQASPRQRCAHASERNDAIEKKASHDDQPAKVETLLTTEQAAWLPRVSRKTLKRMRVAHGRPRSAIREDRQMPLRQLARRITATPQPTSEFRTGHIRDFGQQAQSKNRRRP